MIAGIEPLFQRIADAMVAGLTDTWTSALYNALFYPKGSIYEAEYVRPNGVARSFQPGDDGSKAIRELRRLFKQSGKPLWGQVWFTLYSDGSFKVRWGYEDCDANGDLLFDEEAELKRHEARIKRLSHV